VISDPAGHNQIEVVQVGVHIQGESVHRDPARNTHTNRSQFFVAGPNSGQPIYSAGRDSEIAGSSDQYLFEITHIFADITAIRGEFDDRVSYQLPRTMIGHIAAATCLEELDAQLFAPHIVDQHICPLRRASQRDDMPVFEQQKHVRNILVFAPLVNLFL
jgi:hypothetical protein